MTPTLESLQSYDQCWQPREQKEVFSCQCGEILTELEYSKNNGTCFGCRQEEDS